MANALPDMNPRRTVLARKLFQSRNGKTLGMAGRPGYKRPSNPASDAFGSLQKYLQQMYAQNQQGQSQQDPFADTTNQTTQSPTAQTQAVSNPYANLGNPNYSSIDFAQLQNALPGQPGSNLTNLYPTLLSNLTNQ
jgi:hypothetical protein